MGWKSPYIIHDPLTEYRPISKPLPLQHTEKEQAQACVHVLKVVV
jgi:hypothetical protein